MNKYFKMTLCVALPLAILLGCSKQSSSSSTSSAKSETTQVESTSQQATENKSEVKTVTFVNDTRTGFNSTLKMLKDLYQVNYIRFTDLVEPRREYLEKVDDISELRMNFFWELRPNINEEDVARLRKMGLFYFEIEDQNVFAPLKSPNGKSSDE